MNNKFEFIKETTDVGCNIGTIAYSSLNSQLGSKGAYQLDDVESMFYMLIYLAQGFLPWKLDEKN